MKPTNFILLRPMIDAQINSKHNIAIDALNKVFNGKNHTMFYNDPVIPHRRKTIIDIAGFYNILVRTAILVEPVELGVFSHITISHNQYRKIRFLFEEDKTRRYCSLFNLFCEMNITEIASLTQSRKYDLTIKFIKIQ